MKIKNKIYTLLIFLAFLFFSFENVFANVDNKDNITFILNTDDFETIPSKHLEFVEGFDQNTPFEKLFKLDWKKKLHNDQSFVDGYWVRFSVQNNTNKKNIGVTFNYNNEKKVFSLNNKTVIEYPYWNEKYDRWIDDGRVRASYKVIMNPNETTQVYSFFRKKPFDRYMGRDSLHRMTISSWENISTHQFVKIAANLATFAIAITFAIYYLFIFLVSKGNYLWLSLSLFQISFLSITNLVIGRIIGINSWFYASEFSLASISLLFLLLLQFFRQSLNLKVNYPVFNKIFVSTIIFYIVMIFLNLYTSLSWPSIMYLDLNLYPPDMNGPGLVKVKYLFAPFTFLLLTSAVISFLLWKKGSSYAKYLCISFALPFLSAPISGLAYLFYDFNWITWLIINSAVGILFLGMFITFGFAVAQQLNDMKLLALQQQVKLTEAYQRFVPQQLLKNLGKNSILDVSLGDQVNVEMSILFSDIRSFTSISEKMTPKENFSFLNSYLNQMSPIIRENKGYIDKFMGDGVMALFKRGLKKAREVGLKIKINTVAISNFNQHHLSEILKWCGKENFDMTIIEVMPMGDIGGDTRYGQYLPLSQVRTELEKEFTLKDLPERTSGPARYVSVKETSNKLGFITPLTHNFCESCNRVRLTCTGVLYMCLGQDDNADLKTVLREEGSTALEEAIRMAIGRKPKGHDFEISRQSPNISVNRHMSLTGG